MSILSSAGNFFKLPSRRLSISPLRSSLSTFSRPNRKTKPSARVYSKKPQAMSLIDDPDSSVSLNNRSEIVREHKERWQKFDFKWKASASVPPRLGEFQSLKGEAGVLYVGARDELETRKLYSTSLPSHADQTIQWSTFRPANPDASILAYTLSIEENDLLACVT
jgi:hypothetical protein